MRTYKILKTRAQAFDADPEVRELIAEQRDAELEALTRGYSRDKALKLRSTSFDATLLAARGLRYERLDQLMMEHLLGVR
jgi:xylose isomerase